MDPVACLNRLVEALEDGDLIEAAQTAEDYSNWIDCGGAESVPSNNMDSRGWIELCFLLTDLDATDKC